MSNFYRNTFKTSIDVAMSMIEPILMMFVATIVGTIVASIFLPMASMMEVVQRLQLIYPSTDLGNDKEMLLTYLNTNSLLRNKYDLS